MEPINNNRRNRKIIDGLYEEPDPAKALNKLVELGFKPNFEKYKKYNFRWTIEQDLYKVEDELNNILILNPTAKLSDFHSHNRKREIMANLLKLIDERYSVPDDKDIIPIKIDGLTEAERDFIRDRIKDIHQILIENNASIDDKIEFLQGQIRLKLAYDEDPRPIRDFFIKSAEEDIELLKKHKPSMPVHVNNVNAITNTKIPKEKANYIGGRLDPNYLAVCVVLKIREKDKLSLDIGSVFDEFKNLRSQKELTETWKKFKDGGFLENYFKPISHGKDNKKSRADSEKRTSLDQAIRVLGGKDKHKYGDGIKQLEALKQRLVN